jgi:SAM-dependent methyltransferase
MKCFDLDGIERFAPLAETYARGRPSYPREAIALVLQGLRPNGLIVDLGAGPMIATRLLGHAVAVDPNLPMLLAAGAQTGMSVPHPQTGMSVPHGSGPRVVARAEMLPFRAHSIDLLTAFNAFHWFQPQEFFADAHRVLEPHGRLALIWNDWDLGDPFTREFVTLMRSCAGDYPPEDREEEVAPLYATPLFTNIRRFGVPNIHEMDRGTLHLRLQSMSYVPRDEQRWHPLAKALDAMHERYADARGIVRHMYTTSVFVAEPAAIATSSAGTSRETSR